MSREQRFALEYRETATGEPGIAIQEDGTIILVRPDGLRQTLLASTVVTVTLGGGNPFEMSPDVDSVPAGAVTFLVTNAAGFPHEFLLLKTDDTAAAIVAAAIQGGTVDETQYDVLVDSGDLAAHESARFDAFLAAAHYVLLCNEAGHAHLGMAADFTVA